MLLQAIEDQYQDYRRALRREDQDHFDRLFEQAAAHADAAGYLNPDEPMQPILLSMILEQEKRIQELEAQLAPDTTE